MGKPIETEKGVIPGSSVRRLQQPVMVDCAPSGAQAGGPLVVLPLLDGDRIAGLEIRCGCGRSAVVECVYETEEKAP